MNLANLPVIELLPRVQRALPSAVVVLQAPPGAGKSTALPYALLTAAQSNGLIILVQPRRVAALSIARYLSSMMGESPGQSVGYWVRQERKSSASTKLLVVTDGMFTQMIQHDPLLSGIDLVIFDEFHERNLHCDLGLAFALETRELRPDLGVLIMSATIPAQALGQWLESLGHHTEVLQSEGRSFPVDLFYRPPRQLDRWLDAIPSVIQEACMHAQQGILVFLPGMREIRRVREHLRLDGGWQVMELHGRLSLAEQQRVLTPLDEPGQRKLVLATNLAETSVTIPDIDVVVDSGRERQARYVERYLQTQLVTRMIPIASAEQRAGRAGRVRAGRCYRLWSESQQQGFAKFSEPALATENLASTVLEAAAWGTSLPQLSWFTPPANTAVQRALQQLQRLDLVARTDKSADIGNSVPTLTAKGKAVQQLGTDLHVGCMLHFAMMTKNEQLISHAALLAAHLDEQEWRRNDELSAGLVELLRDQKGYPRTHRRYRYWCKRLGVQSLTTVDPRVMVELGLALEPYWLAKRRDSGEQYQLATGVAATLPADFTERPEWLLVTGMTLSEGRSDGVIRQGIAVPWAHISSQLDRLSRTESRWFWRGPQGRLRRQIQQKIGAILVSETETDAAPSADEFSHALMSAMVSDPGPALFSKPPVEQFLRRVQLAAEQLGCRAEDWQAQALLDSLPEWAALYVRDCRTLVQARQWNPLPALQARLGYQETKTLDRLLPDRWQAPSGRFHNIHYDEHGAAVVRLKLQEVFGEPRTPRILSQTLPLTFELLSPAGRPLQRTQDLASFWQDGYPLVRKEMRGRYPKHPWPEDPVQAIASHKTKRALEQ
ncbi:ATP-dependent helicase HrpB [Aliidiomarina halalkaliphila]|uniref:ATP-dependent helicase HrpB n=1 Tax=Aliidiomarina halalkaliphila TaxID=2593535 RepID=A0A552WZQ4_9GAMM|nr:ATP-dependent helicase HrpB [Aliidiomarina halalkaliphila]TRW48166.1 ATP-dependent helicase HrpB [Aliidiomarina halalkaliphila]